MRWPLSSILSGVPDSFDGSSHRAIHECRSTWSYGRISEKCSREAPLNLVQSASRAETLTAGRDTP
jgi:hypothetical protein